MRRAEKYTQQTQFAHLNEFLGTLCEVNSIIDIAGSALLEIGEISRIFVKFIVHSVLPLSS